MFLIHSTICTQRGMWLTAMENFSGSAIAPQTVCLGEIRIVVKILQIDQGVDQKLTMNLWITIFIEAMDIRMEDFAEGQFVSVCTHFVCIVCHLFNYNYNPTDFFNFFCYNYIYYEKTL